jgi:RHS repeat-associated protein
VRAARLVRRLVLAGAALALILAAVRPALAQGGLYGVVDTPAINGTVSEPFQIRGWALWTTAASGAGVDAIHVYGCPIANCPAPVFWGAATIGLARPDVAATYGNPAGATSGYSFTMSGLTPTVYYVQVWVHVIATGAWQPFNTSFTVTAAPEHVLEHPVALQSLAQPLTVSGWAIDAGMPSGTGVDAVHVWAYHNFGNGTPQYMLGAATYGDARPDVAAARGSRFLHSGYHFTMTGQPPGWYRFVVSSHSLPSAAWTGRTVDAYVDIPTASLEINRSGTGTGSIVGTGLSCPGGSNTQAMPCGASYALGTVAWITAVPDPGSTFAGWGGGCLGPQATCGVTLNGDRYTFAYFTKTPDTVATTYYHTDAIGSVRALSDDTGATVIRHDYLPFGEDTQPLAGDPMRFAGKELDPESALMNFEARYYRNTWGRFTQVDPVSGTPADPQSWNRYAYALNNPLRFVDPSGLCGEPATSSSSMAGDHLNVGIKIIIPCDAGTYNGSGMWGERNGMTPSPGDDLGPYGCGWTPDANGNFYMWNSGCTINESQQVAIGAPTQEPPPPTPRPPDSPEPDPPTPPPSSMTKRVACAMDVGLNLWLDAVTAEWGGLVAGALGVRFNVVEGITGTGSWFDMGPTLGSMADFVAGEVKGAVGDHAAASAAYVTRRHLERKAAKGVGYAAREVEAARRLAAAAKVVKVGAGALAGANLVSDLGGCW